jgi:F-type H+-transporting ATPase subunit delta
VAKEAHFSGIAERYALAIFELAQEENAIDTVSGDFVALEALMLQSADLKRFVSAPVFSREEQKKGMAAILDSAGVAKLTRQFVLLMAAKRRLFLLSNAIGAFQNLVARQHGEVEALVTAARPLAEAEIAELKRVLKAKLGREPRLETSVDPALLGGLVVKVGSRMIDSSLRTKLNGIRMAMRGA